MSRYACCVCLGYSSCRSLVQICMLCLSPLLELLLTCPDMHVVSVSATRAVAHMSRYACCVCLSYSSCCSRVQICMLCLSLLLELSLTCPDMHAVSVSATRAVPHVSRYTLFVYLGFQMNPHFKNALCVLYVTILSDCLITVISTPKGSVGPLSYGPKIDFF